MGLAASWDPKLAVEVGGGIGRDARARGVDYMLGPGVNIYRSPRNGRNFEYFGEDPYLASQIAVGYIDGMQAQGVSSTIKHFLVNNSEFLRHDSNTVVGERAIREIYLPTFKAGAEQAHVGAIMDSYNLINGQHATQNRYFNIDIVRNEWHYPGVVMSDWDATYDGVAAANGGLDIEMPTGQFMNPKTLAAAITDGKLSEATIDEKIKHILTTAMSFGWIDADGHARTQTDTDLSFVDTQNNAVALQSARESAVLLKNDDHLLPLEKSRLKTILVVGPDAYPGVDVGGGSAGVVPLHLVSPVEGIAAALGSNVNVLYDRGLPTISELAHATDFTTTEDGTTPGVTVEAFANAGLSGTPTQTTTQKHISLAGMSLAAMVANLDQFMDLLTTLSQSAPKQTSNRITGYFHAPTAGRYLVVLEGSGEGSGDRLYVDGKLVVDDWAWVRAFQPWVALDLTAGPHKIVAENYQKGFFGGHLAVGIALADKIVHARAVEMAAKADAVVVCAGFDHDSESEGGDRTFALPVGQDELINAMAAANKKTIVTVTAGGNVDSNAWLDHVPAILYTWYAGQDAGTALAEILLGQTNPSGHLPATFERHADDNPSYNNYYPAPGSIDVHYNEGIFVGYRGYIKNNVKPLFPFGYGLSYTTFKISDLKVTPEFSATDPHVTVSFSVTNTGDRAGAEVAQVYVSDGHAKVETPERELKGFERVELAPKQTKQVSITLNRHAFAYYDVDAKKWTISAGSFGIHVGDNVDDLILNGKVEIPQSIAASTF
ncbi:MAG TPA: glycoside hydrolase family 3 C-terminal domain-containing protein [Acidobacteriaceae bacterium]